jgi:hypothetical protein
MSVLDIINGTKCPFAKKAIIPEVIVIKTLDFIREINAVRYLILNFFLCAKKLKYDALCFAFTPPVMGNTIENLMKYTKMFLKTLSLEFGGFELPEHILDYNEFFWPSIENERFFMISFASCYANNSSRYNYGDPYTYFFIQPVSSFVRHANNGDAITDNMRAKIRNLFSKNNQPYDGSISSLKNELVKMVMPLKIGDSIIEWWKT